MIAAIITCQSADVYGGVWMLYTTPCLTLPKENMEQYIRLVGKQGFLGLSTHSC